MTEAFDFKQAIREERQREAANRKLVEQAIRRGVVLHDLVDYGAIPEILYKVWKSGRLRKLSHHQRELLIQEIWVRSKNHGVGTRAWVQIFKWVGFLHVWEYSLKPGDSEPSRPALTLLTRRPKKALTAWRGASLSSHGWGMSWTLHREVATHFAQYHADREQEVGAIFRATVPPGGVLACFVTGEEQEIVVNPQMLRGRVVLEERVPPSLRTGWPPG